MYGTCLGHVWYVFGTYLDMCGPSPFRYRLLRLERSTQCVKDADKVARRMCLRWNVGSCRTICFYLNPTTSYFCSTFSLLNSRYIGAAHLGASLYVVCEKKKKKFSKTSCVSNRCCSWAFSGDTTSHEWFVSLLVLRWMQGAARSISNCGTSSLEFVCDVDDLFSFVRVRSCWQFLRTPFKCDEGWFVVHVACWCYSCRPTLRTI